MNKQFSVLPGFFEINGVYIDLARQYDVDRIGILSKDLVEDGLSQWIWNPRKVAEQIYNPDSLVLVAREEQELIAFVIADFKGTVADLVLLGVSPEHQRFGIGSRLVKILEQSAVALGHSSIQLEVRSRNKAAQNFYKRLGYKKIRVIPHYYSNHENAIQMTHRLSYQPALFST